jgi:hypothetical protein
MWMGNKAKAEVGEKAEGEKLSGRAGTMNNATRDVKTMSRAAHSKQL